MSKPTPPTGRRPSLELEERNKGGDLAVARTLLSDGTRVDRIGVLSTRTSFFREKLVVCLVPLVECVRPIAVITLGLLFEPQLRFTVHIFSRILRASLIRGILKTQEWGKYDGDEPRQGEL